jgi:hypothetical protein
MDGDSRGGAALSVKAVSGKPIKFVGAGEKLEALEPFYPDRLTSRILGQHLDECPCMMSNCNSTPANSACQHIQGLLHYMFAVLLSPDNV